MPVPPMRWRCALRRATPSMMSAGSALNAATLLAQRMCFAALSGNVPGLGELSSRVSCRPSYSVAKSST
jgi:hypothetical protein